MTFTYPLVGATRNASVDMDLPAGYQHLRVRTTVGHGPDAFRRAADALMSFRMHRRIPVGLRTSAPRAAEDVTVTVKLAAIVRAPCRIVWAEEAETRSGWGYGTLPGHPERGEEAFVVDLAPDGAVTLTVVAFSRPANLLARLGGPLIPVFQRLYAFRCGQVLRRLARA